mgnify:FL=1
MYLKTKHCGNLELVQEARSVLKTPNGTISFETPSGGLCEINLVLHEDMGEFLEYEAFSVFVMSESGKTIDSYHAKHF